MNDLHRWLCAVLLSTAAGAGFAAGPALGPALPAGTGVCEAPRPVRKAAPMSAPRKPAERTPVRAPTQSLPPDRAETQCACIALRGIA